MKTIAVLNALKANPAGYLTKATPPNNVLPAIHEITKRNAFFS